MIILSHSHRSTFFYGVFIDSLARVGKYVVGRLSKSVWPKPISMWGNDIQILYANQHKHFIDNTFKISYYARIWWGLWRVCSQVSYSYENKFWSQSRTEVFKLWVATQTWVAMALSFGRGPFHDQKKKKKKEKKQTYHCKQTTTKLFFN